MHIEALGDQDLGYAQTLHAPGCVNALNGRSQADEPLLKEAVEVRRLVLGEQHVDYVRSVCALAKLYEWMSRHSEAAELLNRLPGVQRATNFTDI